MASNDVELSEQPQLDSAASHNPVLCQPDMTSRHVRDDPRAGMIRRARSRHRAGFFGKLDRASGNAGTSLWIDPERKLALVLLTNRTQPDRANKAIQEVRPAFHDALAEGMASRRRSCAPN
jgi:CubicO group peptidase (beta-lactamase class C family)